VRLCEAGGERVHVAGEAGELVVVGDCDGLAELARGQRADAVVDLGDAGDRAGSDPGREGDCDDGAEGDRREQDLEVVVSRDEHELGEDDDVHDEDGAGDQGHGEKAHEHQRADGMLERADDEPAEDNRHDA
jgi:hypothetical protein